MWNSVLCMMDEGKIATLTQSVQFMEAARLTLRKNLVFKIDSRVYKKLFELM